jgi:uracil-DNA glycosylase
MLILFLSRLALASNRESSPFLGTKGMKNEKWLLQNGDRRRADAPLDQ